MAALFFSCTYRNACVGGHQASSLLELLVFQFALQLLRLGHLAHSLVEVVLIDGISIIFDGKQTTTFVSLVLSNG